MTNPLCDPYFILAKVYQGGKYLKQAISETFIESLNKARTVKICYGVLEKDIYWGKCKKSSEKFYKTHTKNRAVYARIYGKTRLYGGGQRSRAG